MVPLLYFNDVDNFCCQWIGNLFQGRVDSRSIAEVAGSDLEGFDRCHFFAGIGGWEYALDLAGWNLGSVWTGSCPCQPYSNAGNQRGDSDARNLWPEFRRLIDECRPIACFGEQVASKLGREWLSRVFADLEGMGYAVAGADLCGACIGAPHIRQRLYWGAWLGQSAISGLEVGIGDAGVSGGSRLGGPWEAFELASCSDGKKRRIESGVSPVAYGLSRDLGSRLPELRGLVKGARSNRVGRLKGYGNAIIPQVAAVFVKSFKESICQFEN